MATTTQNIRPDFIRTVADLSARQVEWCAANGIEVVDAPEYRTFYFTKGSLSVQRPNAIATYVDVVDFDHVDEQCGEPAIVERVDTLKAALAFLAKA